MGGAANVARSMANLNLDIELTFNENTDKKNQFSDLFQSTIKESNLKLFKLQPNSINSIPTKIRYYVDGKQFMREDLEQTNIFLKKNF